MCRHMNNPTTSRRRRRSCTRRREDPRPTPPVYLITAGGIDALHKFASLPSADVDVISVCFKERCNATDLVTPTAPMAYKMETHFYPNSTWTEARNFLYQLAERKEKRERNTYLYYVFLDQDYVPAFNPDVPSSIKFAAENSIEGVPMTPALARRGWTYFERKLVEYLPAMASPLSVNSPVPFGTEEVTMTYYLDAAVNAFHRDALAVMLPYATIFDDLDWCTSQGIILLRMRCIYGSAVQFNGIAWAMDENGWQLNGHSQYPGTGDPMALAMSRIDEYLPTELQGMTWPITSAPRNGALAPYIAKKANWLAAIPASCFKKSMRNVEHRGYTSDSI